MAGGPADTVAFTEAKHDWIAATLAHLGLADEQPRRLYAGRPRSPTTRIGWPQDPSDEAALASGPLPCLAIGCSLSLLQPRKAWVLGRAGLEERIPSPLTLVGDLGKRRSAQR